jgi:uncharacterized protein YhaN
MKKISIIVPAYNEEESLPFLYERLTKLIDSIENYEFEVLFINDGSKDKTLETIKEIRQKDEITAEIEQLKEEREKLLKKYSSLMRAYSWLSCAHDEIKSNFAPRLNKKASELLSYLTSDKYEDMRSDDNFGINLKTENSGIVKAEFMSRGTYDLIYIALRFASMLVLTDGKIPMLILDDAFSQLDDERLKKSAELIKNSEEFNQVFLFTCHENYKEILKDSNVIELE